MKRIVLCADDYGQGAAVSQGIIALIQQGRLAATSCLVNSPHWQEHAKWLAPFQQNMDIGLHFNLTEGKALSEPFRAAYGERLFSLPRLMVMAFSHRLDPQVIAAECHAQLDCFLAATGHLPHFIDGHQHVQQFPVIREVVIHVYQTRLQAKKAYIRLVNEKIGLMNLLRDFKKLVIVLSGTRALASLLAKHEIPHNSSFAGIYSFAKAKHYAQLFPRFLAHIQDKGMIMCHPGLCSLAEDAIAQARYHEYQYLMSEQFEEDCERNGVVMERLVQN